LDFGGALVAISKERGLIKCRGSTQKNRGQS